MKILILANFLIGSLLLPTTTFAASLCDGLDATSTVSANENGITNVYGTQKDDVIIIKNLKSTGKVYVYLNTSTCTGVVGCSNVGNGGNDLVCVKGSNNIGNVSIRGSDDYGYTAMAEKVDKITVYSTLGKGEAQRARVRVKDALYVSIMTGAGNDDIDIEADDIRVSSGDGDDYIYAHSEKSGASLHGEGGNDWIGGTKFNDYISGGDGIDQIWGNEGDDFLTGCNAINISGTSDPLQIVDEYKSAEMDMCPSSGAVGGGGIYGGDGDDVIIGSDGNDFIEGGLGHDYIEGRDGNDVIYLSKGSININKGTHNWALKDGSESGSFIINTIVDSDGGVVYGGTGNDTIWGSDGADKIRGGKHNDVIYGMEGNDDLFGESGDDRIYGMGGDDDVSGGDGTDYRFHNYKSNDGKKD